MDFCEHCNGPIKMAGTENGPVVLDAGSASRYVLGEVGGDARATLVNTWQEHVCPAKVEQPALAEVGLGSQGSGALLDDDGDEDASRDGSDPDS